MYVCIYIEWKHPVVTNYTMSASGLSTRSSSAADKTSSVYLIQTSYLKRSRLTCTGKYPTFIRSFRAADDVLVNPIALRICHDIKDQFHKQQKMENLTTPFNKEWYYV